MSQKKQQLVYFVENTSRYGYAFRSITVYASPAITPIAEMIEKCDRPGWYQSAEIAATQKRRYEELRNRGAHYIVDTMYAPRVRFEWQETREARHAYCRAKITLSERIGELDRDFAFYRSLTARLRRAWKSKRVEESDHPDTLLLVLKGALRAEEMRIQEPGSTVPWSEYALTSAA